MTTEQYLEHKESLLAILSDIISVENLPQEYKERFDERKRKLQEDEFNIALIGEFQGGKSTTIDALCDGREISPRGNNMKTSACRIKVSNITDGEEHAIVTWKSNTELVLTISSILDSIDPKTIGYREEDKKPFLITEYLNLDNPNHMDIVKKIIKEKWETVDDDDERDILLIAEFIVNFYRESKQIRQRTEFGIEEISHIVTFPDYMAERFDEDGIQTFGVEEALFAFVQSVHCFIHSEALQRLGCTFIDCPGLFASEYDTSIATQTLIDSDATLYLIGGEKAMGKPDKRALGEIAKIKTRGLLEDSPEYKNALENIFFAMNQRKSDYETSFVNQDLSAINRIGYNKKNLPKYNALLYYYACFGKSYLYNTLDSETISRFLNRNNKHKDSKSENIGNIEAIWVKNVNQQLYTLDIDEKVSNLDKKAVEYLFGICGSKIIFDEIETYVINQKANSILVDNGAKKIEKSLKVIEEQLKQTEEAATADVLQKAEEYAQARADYNSFKDETKELLDRAFPDETVLFPLVNEVYNDYFRNPQIIEEIAFQVTKLLSLYVKKGATRWKGLKKIAGKIAYQKLEVKAEQQIRSEIEPFFSNAFRESLTPILKEWITKLKKGTDHSYKTFFVSELNILSDKIFESWNLKTDSSPLLKTIEIYSAPIEPENLQAAKIEYTNYVGAESVDDVASLAVEDAIDDLLYVIVGMIVHIVVMMFVDIFILAGLGMLCGLIIDCVMYIFKKRPEIKSKADFKKKELAIFNSIVAALNKALGDDENRQKICFKNKNSLVAVPRSIADAYRVFYRNEFMVVEHKLNDKIVTEQRQLQGSQEELQRISDEAKNQRVNVIEPLKKRIIDFISSIKNG